MDEVVAPILMGVLITLLVVAIANVLPKESEQKRLRYQCEVETSKHLTAKELHECDEYLKTGGSVEK